MTAYPSLLIQVRRVSLFALFAFLFAQLVFGQTDKQTRYFTIAEGDASMTLLRFSEQATTQLVYVVDEVRGIRTRAVQGEFLPRVALEKMVEGTRLVVSQEAQTGALTVRRKPSDVLSTDYGAISGRVLSVSTRNLLEGATVEIPSLNRSALTDRNGRFTFERVPAGGTFLRVSYIGFEPLIQPVEVSAGSTANATFELGSEVVQLAQFVVQSEREGQALALTSQRNATNAKNVVALDAFGNLPNLSAGELAARLPGVAPVLDNEDNITGVAIRGTPPEMNRVMVDGNLIANSGGFSRSFQMHSMTGAMFEELELIKGQTPDRSADSVGGGINLKTRSPLSLAAKRRINYSFGARWAAPFLDDYTSFRRAHPIHPLFNLAYQEVFSAFGGERNLGVAVNAFYSENVNTPDQIIYDYQNTVASPAYIWDYRTLTRVGARRQASINLKAEYRVSPHTKLISNLIYNDANEDFNREFATRAFSNQTIAALDASGQPTGAGAILPDYTATQTTVRAVAGSNFELSSVMQSFINRTRLVTLGAEHRYDRWEINYDGSFSQAHANLGHGQDNSGGSLVMRVAPVGWTLDTTHPERPVFTQTSGPSIYDVANYRTAVQNTLRNSDRDVEIWTAKADVTYRFDTSFPLALKGGAFYREQFVAERARNRRWNYTNVVPLPAGTTQRTAVEEREGVDLPFVDPANINGQLSDTALWTEDIYFRDSQKYSLTRESTEEINAAYLMTQGRWKRTAIVTGVRVEHTEVSGFGYVRVAPATAAQIPDPAARAEYDWNHPVNNHGTYARWFPSVHATYDFTKNLKARASWSTSFGRPAFTNLVPSATINDAQATVVINNPALGPQYATNVDVALEYYFKPAGVLSVAYFDKKIDDFILVRDIGVVGSGDDNGFDGSYSGYILRSAINAGSAQVRGWEIDYRQQLTFLPGALRGLTVSANYTWLETEGDYGGETPVRTNEVAGFIPRTVNASLTYKYRRLGARVLLSHTGRYLGTAAVQPARQIYREKRTVVNAGASFELRPNLTLFCDATNIFNAPQETYRYVPIQVERVIYNGPSLTFGVSGRF